MILYDNTCQWPACYMPGLQRRTCLEHEPIMHLAAKVPQAGLIEQVWQCVMTRILEYMIYEKMLRELALFCTRKKGVREIVFQSTFKGRV